MTSELFDAERWKPVEGFETSDITYHRAVEQGTVRIAFDRPEVRNAFRPHTVDELYRALDHARMWTDVGTVLLTGNGPSPTDGVWAFCSGGDQRIRGSDGYRYAGKGEDDGEAHPDPEVLLLGVAVSHKQPQVGGCGVPLALRVEEEPKEASEDGQQKDCGDYGQCRVEPA